MRYGKEKRPTKECNTGEEDEETETASDIMFIKENLAILHKYYVQLAVEERGKIERAIIEFERVYLPPIGTESGKLDVGKE